MEELKLIATETLRNLIYEKFERMPDYPKTAEEEDPLAKVCDDRSLCKAKVCRLLIRSKNQRFDPQGEFEVIKQLVGSTTGAAEAKRLHQVAFEQYFDL